MIEAKCDVSGQGMTKMKPCKVWIEQCEAARRIKDNFGVPNALAYLVGEKFLNFLEVAETDVRRCSTCKTHTRIRSSR